MGDWLCDTFGAFCADHGEFVTHAAPEIDAAALALGVFLVMGVLAIVVDHERGRGKR